MWPGGGAAEDQDQDRDQDQDQDQVSDRVRRAYLDLDLVLDSYLDLDLAVDLHPDPEPDLPGSYFVPCIRLVPRVYPSRRSLF